MPKPKTTITNFQEIHSHAQLEKCIKAVVDYNWNAERRDFMENEESRPEHIFNALVALHNWIGEARHTPEMYLNPKVF